MTENLIRLAQSVTLMSILWALLVLVLFALQGDKERR